MVVREPLVARVRPTSGRTAEEFPLLRRFLRVAMAMPEPDVLELEHARCEQD